MPRKKLVEPIETTPTPALPESTEIPSAVKKSTAKPKAAPAAKAAAKPSAKAEAAPTAKAETKPAAKPRTVKPKAAPVVAPTNPFARVEVPPEVEAAIDAELAKPPKKARTPAKKAAPTVIEIPIEIKSDSEPDTEDWGISLAWRPAGESTPSAPQARPEPSEERGNRRDKRRDRPDTRGAKKPAPVAVEAIAPVVTEPVEEIIYPEGFDFASGLLPEPLWRPRQKLAADLVTGGDSDGEDSEESEEGGSREDQANRRRRRRRRGGKGPVLEEENAPAAKSPASAPKPVTAKVAEPVAEKPAEPVAVEAKATPPSPFRRERPAVKLPEKAAIPIPDDAPQVVMRNGVPTLVRDHRVYPPIMFFGSPADEKRAETVLEQVRMAAEAGVHIHSYLIELDIDLARVDEAAKFAAYMLSRSVQIDPESQVIFRVVLQAPRNWQEKYPNSVYKNADGSLAEPSVCDDDFWKDVRTSLERFVLQMRLISLKDHILGIHLERGEWFFAEGAGYDDSRAAQIKFREWTRTRYLDDEVTLRASWFDGAARFDSIRIPEYQPDGQEGERFIRSSRRQRRYVDYHLFLSDATVQRIADLAYTAKEASEGYFLIGASYGYTFEWSHPASGHLSLGKLLRTPEIDFLAGPPSYRTREPGGSAPFPVPIDSFALNGKLYISEEDFKTSLSVGHEPDDFNPQMKTPQALESVQWRGAGAALAHASGVAWMDLWGNGWLRTHSVWERAKKIREAMIDRAAAPLDDPEVAIFIDERALAYLVDSHAFKLLVQNVRESVLRAGVSAAFYLLSDLAHREKFPESKLYLFLNAWDVRPELRAAIKSRLQRDNKVLFWLYAAGLFDAGRDSLERAREITGIALKPQPFFSRSGTSILNRRHPLAEAFPERTLVGGTKMEPSYFAIPEGATVLGEYSQTGLPSFVVKEFNEGPAETHWKSVFLGEPMVNPALIRALAQMAGAHVWNFHEDVVHVRHPFCTVHCKGAGPRTITLPGKFSAYNLLNDEWSAVDSPNVRFTAVDGSTYCFLVGPRAELEHQLNADPRAVLHMEELPPREANIRVDGSNFDVPIMKLDEWIGGGDTDDNADEWFLRPHQIEEEPMTTAEESPERVGQRRRRRRGNRKDEPGYVSESFVATSRPDAPGGPASDYDDVGMNVMFRKRE